MTAGYTDIENGHANARAECPLVSVIIPAYNYEEFIAYAIESAIGQSYSNIEVIVVDDGSTDETADEVRKFGSSVRYFLKENGGLANARNFGIKKSKGDLLIFLDADDELEPDTIETMHDCMCRMDDDYAIIACSFSKIDQQGKIIGLQGNVSPWNGDISCRQLLLRNRFPVTALVKRSVILDCGMFDPGYGTGLGSEDRDMWVRVSSKYKVYMLIAPLLRKRVHSLNMSSKVVNQNKGILRTIHKARAVDMVSRGNVVFWAQVSAVRLFQVALMKHGCADRAGAWRSLLISFLKWPYFFSVKQVGLARFFRLRCALRWMIRTDQ